MVIERKNFRFGHIINIENILAHLQVFHLLPEDVQEVDILREDTLNADEYFYALKNTSENSTDSYCYIKIRTRIAGDNETKMLIIEKIIVDNNLIDERLFAYMFKIILRQNDNNGSNRICISSINKRFHGNIESISDEISSYVTNLFHLFTNSTTCTSYSF